MPHLFEITLSALIPWTRMPLRWSLDSNTSAIVYSGFLPGATVFRVGEAQGRFLILGRIDPEQVCGAQVRALET